MRMGFLFLGVFFTVSYASPVLSQVLVKGSTGFSDFADSIRESTPDIFGYRIVLAFDYNKNLIDSLKLQFQEKNPKTEAYIIYESPNFKLVAGDFRTEIEAQFFSKKIPYEFPLSLVQKMPINLPRID